MSVVQLRGGGYLRTEALRFTFPAVMDRLDQIAAESEQDDERLKEVCS